MSVEGPERFRDRCPPCSIQLAVCARSPRFSKPVRSLDALRARGVTVSDDSSCVSSDPETP